jgi:hypothetical protein
VQPTHKTEYPGIPSAMTPVPHDDSNPVPEPLEEYNLDSEPESEEVSPKVGTSMRADKEFSLYITTEPNLITPDELKCQVRDMDLPKTEAQLLGSRFEQCNLVEKGVKVSFYRNRQANIASYFSMDGVFCILQRRLWVDGRN